MTTSRRNLFGLAAGTVAVAKPTLEALANAVYAIPPPLSCTIPAQQQLGAAGSAFSTDSKENPAWELARAHFDKSYEKNQLRKEAILRLRSPSDAWKAYMCRKLDQETGRLRAIMDTISRFL